ncbi:MAG TPA: hypothetical protein VKX16_11290 [Chloroflexota bacterium]|nr:hypothetical protein [Chloroflexota bacterium]
MVLDGGSFARRPGERRRLIRQYVSLQRDLSEEDPASSSYQATIHAFRQLGHVLIHAGLEDDLDRLLRLRVLDGGLESPSPRSKRRIPPELHTIERRARL